MIAVAIHLDREGNIVRLHTKGHTGLAHREICAGVSTLEYTFLYSLKALTQVRFELQIDRGFFSFRLSDVDFVDHLMYNHLSRFYLIGIRSLAEGHKRFIDITIREE